LGVDDPVIEVKVTPNLGHCLGVLGIARDLGAAEVGTAKAPNFDEVPGSYQSPVRWTHGYEAKPDSPCPIVVGRHFMNVKNGPSRAWRQNRRRDTGPRAR